MLNDLITAKYINLSISNYLIYFIDMLNSTNTFILMKWYSYKELRHKY